MQASMFAPPMSLQSAYAQGFTMVLGERDHTLGLYGGPTGFYPLCGETLEPLARFVRKLPKDSNLAEDDFPGLINQEFLGSFSTDKSICSA